VHAAPLKLPLIINTVKMVSSTGFSFSSVNTLLATFSILFIFNLSSSDIEFSIHDLRHHLSMKSIVLVSFPSGPIIHTVAVFSITFLKALAHAVVTTSALPVAVEQLVPVAPLPVNLGLELESSVAIAARSGQKTISILVSQTKAIGSFFHLCDDCFPF
jgi:hypothetical protein